MQVEQWQQASLGNTGFPCLAQETGQPALCLCRLAVTLFLKKKKQICFGEHTYLFPLSRGKIAQCWRINHEQIIENGITNIQEYWFWES